MKRKLLFAIAALLCSVGSWAQTWYDITSQYLTNAAVADASGWTAEKGDVIIANDANWTGRPEDVCLNHGWNTGETNFYQTVWLPKGSYRLTVMTRGHASVNSNIYAYDVSAENNLALTDIAKNGAEGENNGWVEKSIEFTLTEAKNV